MAILAFSVTLLRPEWLLVLLGVPLFAWIALRGRKTRARAGDVAAIAARAVMLAAIALALSLPRIEKEGAYRATAFVLDVSDSIPKDRLDRMKDYVRRAAAARGEDDDASLVLCADGAAVESPMTRVTAAKREEPVPIDPMNLATRVGTGESDLAGGLRLAQAGFAPGGSRRVFLVTDANETRGDLLQTVKDLLAERIDVMVAPVDYAREREVLVQKIVAPPTAPEGAPVPVRVVVWSTHDGITARIRCKVDGQDAGTLDATLKQGTNVYSLDVPFATSGLHRIEAIIEPSADGDPVNNRGAAATLVRGRGRILVVSDVAQSLLAKALSEHFPDQVDAADPSSLPSDPGGYLPYDALVLENIAAFAMTDVQRKVLASSVRELGLGLVCVGGTQTYGPGGYLGTELDEILPVTSEVMNRRAMPAGALVVCLHSCEFPDGNSAGREITKAAIRALSSEDEIGVLQWTGTDDWVIPLQRVGDKGARCAEADKAEPSDMPSFDDSLLEAEKALRRSSCAVKHIVMISDGDPQLPSDKLLSSLVDGLRVTISTVCVDPHGLGGDGPMSSISKRAGGRHYSINSKDRDKLPQIFVKEAVTVRQAAWNEDPFTPTIVGAHRMVKGFDAFRPLHGHVVTTVKPDAELILVGPKDDPILATWRHGLAQTTAFTSDAHARWAQEWVAGGDLGRFWAQVVRASLRAVDRPGFRVATEVDGGTARVVVDALTAGGDYVNGLRVAGRVVTPDGRATDFRATQTGPGRYEGTFPATQVGTYLATINWTVPGTDGHEAPAQEVAAVCVAYSAEHLAQRSNLRLVEQMKAAGATIIDIDAAEAAFARDPATGDPALLPWSGPVSKSIDGIELWPWIAALAAILLVLDVAVRRVRIPWDKLRPAPKKATATPARPAVVARGAARAPVAGAFDAQAAADAAAAQKPGTPASSSTSAAAPQAPAAGDEASLLSAKQRAKKKQTWEEN